ncbi:MAG: Spy/CpxP family protein refolding chaperone [Ginsengibacter sp.]
MKKYLIAFSAFAVMSFSAGAQAKTNSTDANVQQHDMHHNKPGYGMHQHHHHGMMTKLNLTDAQKQQVKDLNSDYKNQLKDLEKSETITLKDYRAKKANLEQERKSKFQSILTTDQKNKIVQAKKERGEKMKMMADKRLEKMRTALNLTDEQVTKIKEQRNNSMEQAKAIRENSSLTQEQKKEQFMSLMKSRKESMNSILTPEQLKKKEEMRDSRMNDMKNKRSNKDS